LREIRASEGKRSPLHSLPFSEPYKIHGKLSGQKCNYDRTVRRSMTEMKPCWKNCWQTTGLNHHNGIIESILSKALDRHLLTLSFWWQKIEETERESIKPFGECP
jgi:hypothetical protein